MFLSSARFYLLLIFTATFLINASAQNNGDKRLISQKFVYKTAQCNEVYMVWAVDYWRTPAKKFWPKNTHLQDKFAYTKLIKQENSFSASITLPYNSRIDYFFWAPKDNKGKKITGWDTNLKSDYTSNFTENKTIELNDSKLYIEYPKFTILSSGTLFLIISLLLFLAVFFLFKKNRKLNALLLVAGFLSSAFIYIFFARAEIAGLYHKSLPVIAGSVFQDVFWLLVIGILFFPLLYIFRQKIIVKNVLLIAFFLTAIITVLSSLLNIEVVKQLGTPFNYRWLYYSDFLRGNDARTGVSETLTGAFLSNIFLLLAGYLLTGIAASIAIKNIVRSKRAALSLMVMLLIFFLVSFYQYKTNYFKAATIQNPVTAFVLSVFEPSAEAQILKTKVSDETAQYIINYHNNFYTSAPADSNLIDNIILFVSESTPKQYISLYDSAFHCTPNLKKWSSISAVYTNMYAQIPSTPNSMLTLVSGIYPMVSYKSAVSEKIQLPPVGLPKLLEHNGWATSLFFSSDLHYADMEVYAKSQGFSFTGDVNTMPCNKKFTITHSDIDGVDDECLIENYFKWADTTKPKKKFSMLWTNQTHYPYYTDTITSYTKEHDNLNRYLNALHHTDKVFGELMTGLKERNQLKSTLVIFVSDHGEAFNTHNQTLHASRIYEENVHIPCVLFNPVLFKGQYDDDIHGLIDIDVTIAHLLGLQKPKEWQGKSLFDTAKDGRTFFISPYTDLILGTRNEHWKYIYNADTKANELYNLATDPKELFNVSDRYPEVVRKEREILTGWVQYVQKQYAQ
ncbi:LTA synthase family protein [Parafilimonas terrae]|uniref:Arylsulfatase A n=1 Tax=Parafilimonas terrae TaxID=1465490 RepID=A0A1I5XT76_9BACT|nr:sulfatase-like hydrolase/transferase [Parafilimonas terrae]SFQ35155.1 Arylsulfatase A [Parafilimonas terrae]